MNKTEKTNVMRVLEQHGVSYISHYYGDTAAVSASEVAQVLREKPELVFKTLVTAGKSRGHYVFVLPADSELSLKKAAKAVGEKSIEMIKMKDLFPLTGYIHGGCSPIGMKKQFPTVFHYTAGEYDAVIFSGGKIGYQVELRLSDIKDIVSYTLADITE